MHPTIKKGIFYHLGRRPAGVGDPTSHRNRLSALDGRWGASKSTSFLVRALIPGTPEETKLRKWTGEGQALI